jgi:hypothetical protein
VKNQKYRVVSKIDPKLKHSYKDRFKLYKEKVPTSISPKHSVLFKSVSNTLSKAKLG